MNKIMYITVDSNMKGISSAFASTRQSNRFKASFNHFHVFRWTYDTVGGKIQWRKPRENELGIIQDSPKRDTMQVCMKRKRNNEQEVESRDSTARETDTQSRVL